MKDEGSDTTVGCPPLPCVRVAVAVSAVPPEPSCPNSPLPKQATLWVSKMTQVCRPPTETLSAVRPGPRLTGGRGRGFRCVPRSALLKAPSCPSFPSPKHTTRASSRSTHLQTCGGRVVHAGQSTPHQLGRSRVKLPRGDTLGGARRAEVDGKEVITHLIRLVTEARRTSRTEPAVHAAPKALDARVVEDGARVHLPGRGHPSTPPVPEIDGGEVIAHLAGVVAEAFLSTGAQLAEVASAKALEGVVIQDGTSVEASSGHLLHLGSRHTDASDPIRL